MKRSRAIWNYIDMLLQILFIFVIIVSTYYTAESLEKYIYRYTVFPFVAIICVFILGILLGRGVERTKKNKPIGLVSKKMAKVRKRKNRFIFADTGETYVPHKEIIEEIKSGEIVHVKKFNDSDFNEDEFYDIYQVEINNMVDNKMDKKNDEDGENKS